jgi:16S rRNA (cytosine967-C5)-methyltransferase
MLLTSLAPLVREGGRLTYATCSSEPEENEQVVSAFLSSDSRFRLEPMPSWAAAFADGFYARTGRDGAGDLFFAALLRRV